MMFRFIRTILRLFVAALIIFFAFSMWKGGGEFRWFGEKLGEKADEIKLKKDEAVEKIKKLTGMGVPEKSQTFNKHHVKTDETSKKKTKETDPEVVGGGSDENKPSESLWDTIWKKMKALMQKA